MAASVDKLDQAQQVGPVDARAGLLDFLEEGREDGRGVLGEGEVEADDGLAGSGDVHLVDNFLDLGGVFSDVGLKVGIGEDSGKQPNVDGFDGGDVVIVLDVHEPGLIGIAQVVFIHIDILEALA